MEKRTRIIGIVLITLAVLGIGVFAVARMRQEPADEAALEEETIESSEEIDVSEDEALSNDEEILVDENANLNAEGEDGVIVEEEVQDEETENVNGTE